MEHLHPFFLCLAVFVIDALIAFSLLFFCVKPNGERTNRPNILFLGNNTAPAILAGIAITQGMLWIENKNGWQLILASVAGLLLGCLTYILARSTKKISTH